MNESIRLRVNLYGAWCGVAYVVLLFFGWFVVAGFFPPHAPSAGAEEIGAFFREDVTSIRLGMLIVMWGAAAFIPFTATVTDYVSKVEGRFGPLSVTTALAGYANAMLTFYPPLWWMINAWRPEERSDELIYLLNDAAWLQFIGALSIVMPMFTAVAIAAFNDKSATPMLPRWAAYASVCGFVLMLPDQLLFFFKTGPFAWNGLIGFWMPASVFCGWFLMLFYLIRRSTLAELKLLQGRDA